MLLGRRFPVFKLFGFQVWIDWSWFLIAVLIAWSLRESTFPSLVKGQTAAVYWMLGIAGALGLFLSIVVHEFAHSYVARKRGLPMVGITLFVFGGIAEMSDEPPSPATEFWMALAGPAMSVLIGIVSGLVYFVLHRAGSNLAASVFGYLGAINITLALFNMVPAFPLDGGRVLRSIIWHFKGDLPASTRIAAAIGGAFAMMLIFFGVWEFISGDFIGGLWLALIGSFLRSGSESSYRQVVVRKALEGEKVRRFMNTKPVVVPAHISIRELVDTYIAHNFHKSYPVEDGDSVVGVVTVDHVRALSADERETRTVVQEAEPTSSQNSISADADAMQALEKMQQNQRTLLLVIDEGHFEGIVTLRDVSALLTLKLQFQSQQGETQVVPPPIWKQRN